MGKKLTLNMNGTELTKKDIKERFEQYNRLYFGGKLGKCNFFWMSPNYGTYGKYSDKYNNKNELISSIGIARNTVWTEENLRELLVHEMIHMYVRTIEGIKLDGVIGHGRHFRAHCSRIKKDYNLNIRIHGDFGYIKKELSPKLWEKVLLWLLDR